MEINKELGQISAINLADFILKNYGPMSHLKLQKLLYYCEGYHLAYTGEMLVHQNFQAWVHGPVCPEVYHELKGHSVLYSDIKFNQESATYNPDNFVKENLSSKQIEIISDVLESLSGWRDSELEAATHREAPWIEARKGLPLAAKSEEVISKITMRDYYRSEIANNI